LNLLIIVTLNSEITFTNGFFVSNLKGLVVSYSVICLSKTLDAFNLYLNLIC